MTLDQSAENPPNFGYFMTRAQELTALVSAEADEAERLHHMTDKVVHAFQEAGLYRMLLPRELDGAELSLSEAMQVVETIARADGSTGWCLMVGNIESGTGGAYLSDLGVERVFAQGSDIVIAGQGIPRGVARSVEGGYQIQGDWSYASGIYHAAFIHTGCVLMQDDKPVLNDAGVPEVLICHVPREGDRDQGELGRDRPVRDRQLRLLDHRPFCSRGDDTLYGDQRAATRGQSVHDWPHRFYCLGAYHVCFGSWTPRLRRGRRACSQQEERLRSHVRRAKFPGALRAG